jgi:hypothetical protein
MDEETKRCYKFVRALITSSIKDMVFPYGDMNNHYACRQAFDFILNEDTEDFKCFLNWCDLADFDYRYWQKIALMNFAYELNFRPWLRYRLVKYLKSEKHWGKIRQYYLMCGEKQYQNFLKGIENGNDN